MDQDETNEREWGNPVNWSAPLGFYRSSLDSRVWVPKQQRWMGWTLNLAKPLGRLTAVVLVALPLLLVAAVLLAVQAR